MWAWLVGWVMECRRVHGLSPTRSRSRLPSPATTARTSTTFLPLAASSSVLVKAGVQAAHGCGADRRAGRLMGAARWAPKARFVIEADDNIMWSRLLKHLFEQVNAQQDEQRKCTRTFKECLVLGRATFFHGADAHA